MATPVSKITGIATGDVLADGSVPFTGAISGTTAAFSGSSLNVNGTGATITFNSATINRNGGTGITTLASGASGHTVKLSMAATEVLSAGSAGVGIASGFPIYWSSTSASDGAGNLFLYARAANVLAQYNSTNAQQYELYNTRTDASNYERGFMRWASNVLEIGCEAAGTGTNRNTRFLIGASGQKYTFYKQSDRYLDIAYLGSQSWNLDVPNTGLILSAAQGITLANTVTASVDNAWTFGGNTTGAVAIGRNCTPAISFNPQIVDQAAKVFSITGSAAYSAATTNIVGGKISIIAGNGASGSAGDAHGANLELGGGTGYGTGHHGRIKLINMPTSATGLAAGELWSNGGVITMV